jgi:hypothetical protein
MNWVTCERRRSGQRWRWFDIVVVLLTMPGSGDEREPSARLSLKGSGLDRDGKTAKYQSLVESAVTMPFVALLVRILGQLDVGSDDPSFQATSAYGLPWGCNAKNNALRLILLEQ